jgi:hypothetical protein
MKYLKPVIIIIIIWSLVVGFAYNTQKLAQKSIENKMGIEGFTTSIKGIITDANGNIIKCTPEIIGKSSYGGRCMDLSYVDQHGQIISKQIVSIYPNYYVDPSSGLLQQVPYGFTANATQTGITPTTKVAAYDISVNRLSGLNNTNMNRINLDNITDYHKNYLNGEYAPDGGGLPTGQMWIKDANGKLSVASIFDSSFNNPLYYEPGSYKYGAANYVPTHENSVYLSNLSNYSQIANMTLAPAITNDKGGGFCSTQNDPVMIDKICSGLDSNTCSSMACCNVLEGGKCVGGLKTGPFFSNAYKGVFNRDFYYYQGKCYGSCNR